MKQTIWHGKNGEMTKRPGFKGVIAAKYKYTCVYNSEISNYRFMFKNIFFLKLS